MKKAIVLVAVLVLYLFLFYPLHTQTPNNSSIPIQLVYAQDNETTSNVTGPVHELSVDRSFFQPLRITVNYPYTHQHDITQISTIGQAAYTHEGGPTYLTFNAPDIDVYTFTITLHYDNESVHTILIAMWEGTLPVESQTWTETGADYTIHFRCAVIIQPHFPTAEEYVNETFVLYEKLYQQQLEKNEELLTNQQNQNNMVMTMVVIFGILSVVSLVLNGVLFKRGRKTLTESG